MESTRKEKMEFQKLNGRNRKKMVNTPSNSLLVLEKGKDTYDNFLRHCLVLWLGIDRQYQRSMLFFGIKLAQRSFFENNPKCKYAVLTGFNSCWALGIKYEI